MQDVHRIAGIINAWIAKAPAIAEDYLGKAVRVYIYEGKWRYFYNFYPIVQLLRAIKVRATVIQPVELTRKYIHANAANASHITKADD
ncbi:hypothetical protein LTR53_020560, partial [Teratosphaeriaceae sp. CCFEE 6253]